MTPGRPFWTPRWTRPFLTATRISPILLSFARAHRCSRTTSSSSLPVRRAKSLTMLAAAAVPPLATLLMLR